MLTTASESMSTKYTRTGVLDPKLHALCTRTIAACANACTLAARNSCKDAQNSCVKGRRHAGAAPLSVRQLATPSQVVWCELT